MEKISRVGLSRVPVGLLDTDSLCNIFTSFGAADDSRYVSRRMPVCFARKNRDVYQYSCIIPGVVDILEASEQIWMIWKSKKWSYYKGWKTWRRFIEKSICRETSAMARSTLCTEA